MTHASVADVLKGKYALGTSLTVKGCTHLLELLGTISTTAYQTLWQTENGS